MIEVKINEYVEIPLEDVTLEGELLVPENVKGIILFSHGSGSSRFSPRNRFVAEKLQEGRLGTLLFDLLTREEDQEYDNRFNIELLTERLVNTTNWLAEQPEVMGLNMGYFGASTGAASALNAAAQFNNRIKAVVSRGGRPDLALNIIDVQAPTLLIVGGNDPTVLALNRDAFELMQCEKEMQVIPGATHLFSEPGKLEEVADLSVKWFDTYLYRNV